MANIAMLCLDETGSMTGQEHRVVMSLNEYVDKLPEDCRICVFTFDSQRWRRFYDGYKTNWVPMQTSECSDAFIRCHCPLFNMQRF